MRIQMVIPARSEGSRERSFSAPIAMMCTPSHRCSSLIFAIISGGHFHAELHRKTLHALGLAPSAAAARRSIISPLRHGDTGHCSRS